MHYKRRRQKEKYPVKEETYELYFKEKASSNYYKK